MYSKIFKISLFLISINCSTIYAQQFSLPPLKYAYEALEPHIDAQTMTIHHTKHHQGYVNNLNKAVDKLKGSPQPLEQLLINAEKRGAAIRNNGGGHYNHSLFWQILSPNASQTIQKPLLDAINESFGTLDSLKSLLNKHASTRFGSGWAWLYVTPQKKLAVASSPNQDNPLMDAMGKERGIPILGIDVWEHAYYLKYQNKRGDYLSNIWNVVNWDMVSVKYAQALASPLLKVIEQDMWQELKDLHMVMAQTFHPMEEGDLSPIKSRSSELVQKAKILKTASVPASFNTPAIQKSIQKLVDSAESLDKTIKKKGKDEKIKAELIQVHDIFHEIQGLCNEH